MTMSPKRYITCLARFHLVALMKILFLSILASTLFINCSKDTSVQPPLKDDTSRKLVFNAKDEQGLYKLYTINDNGTGLKEVFPASAWIGDLWVSPKGDQVVCCVNIASLSQPDYQLFIVNIDGSAIKLLLHGLCEEPQWFPDNEQILYGLLYGPWYGAQIFRTRIDGSNPVRISVEDSTSHRQPRLSPDAQKIAFETRGPTNIRVMNIDGTNNILLSSPGNDAYKPEWTLDSKKVIYGDRNGLWIINADGSNRKRLSDQGGVPHVSPIDGKIVFLGYGGICIINPDGSAFKKVINVYTYGYPILWSRNGTKIAFRGDVNGDRKEGLCTVKADGTDLREITGPALELEPTPCRAFDWML